jgi:hypothetical protein
MPEFEVFDLSVLGADSHLWLSVQSRQGSVFGVSRSFPALSVPQPYASPIEWMSAVVREARTDAGQVARGIGAVLTRLVFGVPDVAALLQQARGAAAARGAQLLVRLLLAPEEISAWPWELLADPQQPDRFLALARDVQLVRSGRSRTYAARQAPIQPPLNLLLVMSSPVPSPGDTDTPFDLYEEKRSLLAELQPLVERGLLRVEVEDRPSVERLRRRMAAERRGFHLFHYLGHAQPAGLRLEERYGRSRLVTGEQMSLLLQQLPDLRLAVFAGCETARAPSAVAEVDRWPGPLSTVDHCVRDASPMVIGMQAVLPFSTERVFTRFLYSAITGGQSVAEALRLARLAVIDDEISGGQLLNWAVPCLFVAGAEPGPLVDPQAKAIVPPRVRRVGLKIGVRQSELRFVSRLNALRVSVDALCGRNDARLLMVLGRGGAGKSRLLDRALEELDADAVQLFVSAHYLLAEADPVQALCDLVARVVAETGQRVPAQGRLVAIRWWERLLEDATRIPLALVVDDGDGLQASADPKARALLEALVTLTKRRGRARLAVAATEEITSLMSPLRASEIKTVWLQPLDWPDVWQWIRRNLPVLTRYPENILSSYYSDLPHLEQWEQLADTLGARQSVTDAQSAEFAEIVVRIGGVPVDVGTPASTAPPPIFGAEADVPAPTGRPVRRGTIRVAIVGPFMQGREAQFARLLTLYAAEHGVAGRTAGSDTADGAALAAELLTVRSPFGETGTASTDAIVQWLHEVREAEADIVLLDIGTPRAERALTRAVAALTADGRLVIASGGNSRRPSYPAWSPEVLAVGALGADGRPAPYSAYFRQSGKPELFAPESVAESALAGVVADSDMKGTSVSALYAVAAAIVVWVTDRDRTARDVRAILLDTADRIDGSTASGPRRLDSQKALSRTRELLLLDALERGPLELHELLAKTGMRPQHAMPLLDLLVETKALNRVLHGQTARYENPEAIYLRYVRMRTKPSGSERTMELSSLVQRARELAGRGRYRADDVVAMWDSGDDGRRIVALAIIEERPDLGAVPVVAAGIRSGRSAFEIYHALRAATALVPQLPPDRLGEIREAVDDLRSGDGAPQGSDRWHLSEQVLELIAGRLTKRRAPQRR